MKKTLLLSVAALTGSVLLAADYQSENSCGVYPVTSSQKETMVAVPFVGTSGDIQINQLVKAQGLAAGDMIYALPTGSGNSYSAWKLNNAKTAWEAITVNEVGSGASLTPPSSADATLPRGQAFWLVRKNNPSSAFTFYVMGVGPTAAASATSITGSAAGTWNLVGQSSATGTVTLSDIASAVGLGGSVRLNDGSRYLYSKNGSWYRVRSNNSYESVTPSTEQLPKGEGFWIVSKATGTVEVNL